MIPRQYGEYTTHECRFDSHELTDKQKRYKQILFVLDNNTNPMTAMEIAQKLVTYGMADRVDRNYVSPRLTEMCQVGICEPVGKKKCRETGRKVTAFQIRKAM